MNLKQLSLTSLSIVAIAGLSLVSCSKKKHGISVKINVDNAKTAKTWGDTNGHGANNGKNWKSEATDNLKSSATDNVNDAALSAITVSYTDEKGQKQTDKPTVSGKDFSKTYQVPEGSEISVNASAKEAAIPDVDTTKIKPENWQTQAKGKRAEESKVTLSIKIEKDGQDIGAAKSVTTPKEATAEVKATVKK